MNQLRIAYFINQYPKVSHSFIRREILALERQGIAVQRIALRGWNADLVDAEDIHERAQTYYVLQAGIAGLLLAAAKIFALRPVRFIAALRLALNMSRSSYRAWPFHLVYLAEACRILPWMHKFGVHHAHAHFGTNSTEVVMLAHALGGPSYSFTVHGMDEFDKPQFINIAEKVGQSAFVVAVSSYGRSQLYRWIDYALWPKVKVVHCGLEKTFYDVAPVSQPIVPRIVCVGRLSAEKGQLLLIKAVHCLALKGIGLELVLAGDGEMRPEIERLIAAYHLETKISITGWISSNQVRAEILNSKCLVLPSFTEGLPVVIMEAMALRRPVISTYVAGIPELVISRTNGWLVPAGSVEELTDAMEDMLSMTREQLAEMGEAAYLRVTERHNIETEATKLAELFRGDIS